MKLKNLCLEFFVLLFTIALITGFSSTAGAAVIKIGSLNDMTGATSDVGKEAGSTAKRSSCISLITVTGCLRR
jgi:hypothetical protein